MSMATAGGTWEHNIYSMWRDSIHFRVLWEKEIQGEKYPAEDFSEKFPFEITGDTRSDTSSRKLREDQRAESFSLLLFNCPMESFIFHVTFHLEMCPGLGALGQMNLSYEWGQGGWGVGGNATVRVLCPCTNWLHPLKDKDELILMSHLQIPQPVNSRNSLSADLLLLS